MIHAVTASSDAPGVQPGEGGSQPTSPLHLWPEADGFHAGTVEEANELLRRRHYLGPIEWGRLVLCQWAGGEIVGAMVWRTPTSRLLPGDGTWLELARWCLTSDGGTNAGSRMHRAALREIKRRFPDVTTLVSYSDPGVGYTGLLYRACNWVWRPTWHRLSPPPTGGGTWDGITQQEPKDRWAFAVREDARRDAVLGLKRDWERRKLAEFIGRTTRREHMDPFVGYEAHEPTPENTDPHIIEIATGTIVEDCETMDHARARAAEMNAARTVATD